MANPTLLTMPMCVNADKNTIPPTDAGTSGLFSEEYGWQEINSLPLASGGKAPNRRDFNGVFALLGGIAYACQRGQSFEWVNNLPYLAGCVVTDPLDGNKYNAKNDVAEGGTNPSLDPTNWELFGTDPNALTREITPAFNTRDVITTSGTYTAPVTGWYKVTAKGGGGGGAGGRTSSSSGFGGAGGGEGGTTIAYVPMTAGETATVVIGAGGNGGAVASSGSNGGDTSITIGGNTYTAGGGKGAAFDGNRTFGGLGGTGTIQGNAGCQATDNYYSSNAGSTGGGTGGAIGVLSGTPSAGTQGGGGAGGFAVFNSSSGAGGAGGNGFVWFEYFATI